MIFRGFPSFNLIAVNSFAPWCFGAVQLVTVGADHPPGESRPPGSSRFCDAVLQPVPAPGAVSQRRVAPAFP